MLTLFQLFTLDQWYNIYRDLIKISNPISSLIYILVWIGIGSFIFRNLFVGIMGKSKCCVVKVKVMHLVYACAII